MKNLNGSTKDIKRISAILQNGNKTTQWGRLVKNAMGVEDGDVVIITRGKRDETNSDNAGRSASR